MKISPPEFIPKVRERVITEDHTEIKFVINKELKEKLEKIRALAGPKGATMDFGELIAFMAQISLQSLENKKFGKSKLKVLSAKDSTAPAPELKPTKNPRYIPRPIWRFVMQRDKYQCVNCGCKRNLNIDHIIPLARGGKTEPKNLRVLCFNCNQRAGMKAFGVDFMERKRLGSKVITYSAELAKPEREKYAPNRI
jgi:5-methylcytosine-specific restriction enzyme A